VSPLKAAANLRGAATRTHLLRANGKVFLVDHLPSRWNFVDKAQKKLDDPRNDIEHH
jgi:hypothetical protein